jgi:hypothetical protein
MPTFSHKESYMRAVTTLRNLSLGVAAASFLLAGAAFASSSELAGGTARLDHTINTKDAHTGQQVEAKLDGTIKTRAGMDLPKGTELMGTISSVRASENGGPSSLSLQFTKAELTDGKVVPVKVMLVGAYPSSEALAEPYGQETMGPAPKHISPKERIDQEAGLLSHVSMIASAQGHNSATFRDKNGNVKLGTGTYFQVGVAPLSGSSNGMMSSGT